MNGANMICPKCNTFQPTALTCLKCGAFVAKLWAQQRAPEKPAVVEPGHPPSRRRSLISALGLTAFAGLGFGLWFWAEPGNPPREMLRVRAVPGTGSAWRAGLDAQVAASTARESLEAAQRSADWGVNTALDGGMRVYRPAPGSRGRA